MHQLADLPNTVVPQINSSHLVQVPCRFKRNGQNAHPITALPIAARISGEHPMAFLDMMLSMIN